MPADELLSARVELASLVAVAVAVLLTVPHVLGVVGEVMCTVFVVPETMSPKEQESTPLEMEHWAAPVPPSIVQLRPALLGSVSVTLTSLAMPAPVLLTTIV